MPPAIDQRLPLALARRHWATGVGDVVDVEVRGPAGRSAPPVTFEDLLVGAGFELTGPVKTAPGGVLRATVRRARTLPDTVGSRMRVLVCGLNPSVVAADAGYGYAGRSNRFWAAALAAGLVTRARDPRHALRVDGVGMTDLVKRATPSAAEVRPDEYRAGAERVGRLVAWLRPRFVLFVGLTGWRTACDRAAAAGWQPDGFAGVPAYVMPSTSGLNAHATPATLAEHIRTALRSAPDGPR